MGKTGAQVFVDTLIAEGVEVIFGVPGGAVIPIFDALYETPLKFILCRHEQGAAHAADGYARASGKVGVCIATSGPGATNLATGIATAHMDSVPVVAFTGQVRRNLIGNDAFQEADTTGITRPITKYNCLVRDPNALARTIHEAFHVAMTGRPGPVLVDLPVDVTTHEVDDNARAEIDLPGYKPRFEVNERQVRVAAELINKAERPVIYAGGGVIIAGASEVLCDVARRARIPVTTTLMALGAIPSDDPLCLGMLGMHGTAWANFAVTNADLLVALGARFDDRVTGPVDAFAPGAEIIQVDIDPASIGKNKPVDVPIVGDVKLALEMLLEHIEPAPREAWHKQIAEWRNSHPLTYDRESDRVKPQYVLEQIAELAPENTIITTEVGQNQMWAAQWFRFRRPRTFITSGGLGTMGFGFPAAIGAQVACPECLVIDVAGDGSIQMNIQELATAVYNKLPVKIAILNNGFLGMVRQWQELFYNRRYSGTVLNGNPDFVRVAEAYGAHGMRISKPEEVRPALEKAFSIDGPVVMDFMVDPEENVFPMVPAGEAIDRMINLA